MAGATKTNKVLKDTLLVKVTSIQDKTKTVIKQMENIK
jgi:hypothetical protein